MHLKSSIYSLVSILSLATGACKSTQSSVESQASYGEKPCSIVIVGGGVAGLHTAYRLAPTQGENVCVFEKEERLGGRLYDLALSPEDEAAGRVIGNGGRRIMETQSILFQLAQELDIEYDTPKTGIDIIYARGKFGSNKDEFASLYPGLVYDRKKSDIETQLLTQIVESPLRKSIDTYADFASYAKAVVGEAGFQYLHDMSRFRGDFEYPLSAKGYVDFLAEELNVCCQTYYPKGGMTAFPKKMAAKARSYGVRIFTGEPVLAIDRALGGYQIRTSKRFVDAKRLVIAVPPDGFRKISGDVAQDIQAMEQFQSLIGVRVTVINQWFAKPWWKELKNKDGQGIWRTYTTSDPKKPDSRCINFTEIPPEKYAEPMNVIRTVYNDQAECAEFWSKLDEAHDDQQRDRLLHEGLTKMFGNNGVTPAVSIPSPIRTTYWEWPDGWYWVRKGSRFSNQDIADWAKQPIPGEPIGLVSEGYNPQRSSWSDGAYKSSLNLLKAQYGYVQP